MLFERELIIVAGLFLLGSLARAGLALYRGRPLMETAILLACRLAVFGALISAAAAVLHPGRLTFLDWLTVGAAIAFALFVTGHHPWSPKQARTWASPRTPANEPPDRQGRAEPS